ncbi:MAG: DUF4954 family protein, partial [Bacteroidota bacterium]|nr:DUF4954 family protein [Bacteroidota bacterium]
LAGDAYLWSSNREDHELMDRFTELTQKTYDNKRGYYGTIGDRSVLKDCNIIKDVSIGSDAYLKGANKLKNLTINSDEKRSSQIGEGCELVNGIIGYGCRLFYGVKAVRFVMASHSQLKYGARLINSYLGNNSTISCCEVLNSLIFPAHEQHHNNSFLCASLIMGQSNIAAGATIGSNHNSRGADGEIVAGRGFWPGLCVSLKHNSRFASFTILAKADFPNELNISLPFSLVSNDVASDKLVIMPGYWFMYNMYALARNTWKYQDRDQRTERIQNIEFDFLAPDTINEMFGAIAILEKLTPDEEGNCYAKGFENSQRITEIVKVPRVIAIFRELISFYGISQLLKFANERKLDSFESLKKSIPTRIQRSEWHNVGGQLMMTQDVERLKKLVKTGKAASWNQVHEFYRQTGSDYENDKLIHAYTSLLELGQITSKQFTRDLFKEWVVKSIETKRWMSEAIFESRAKDYENPFRQMVYNSEEEMVSVIGRLEDNRFIQEQLADSEAYQKLATKLLKKLK